MIVPPRDTDFIARVEALFDSAGIRIQDFSRMLIGVQGTVSIDGRRFKVHIAPLRQSRYVGAKRVGATTVGYRLTIKTSSNVPVRFSVMHQGIKGSSLIAWVNKMKGIHRVPNIAAEARNYAAWSNDTIWAGELRDRDEARLAISRLLECEAADARVGHPCVFMFPDSVQYFRRAATLDGFARLAQYVSCVAVLAQTAAEIAPPTRFAAPSLLERIAKTSPVLAGGLGVVCILLFFSALLGGIFWLAMM